MDLAAHADRLAPHLRVIRPEGPSPFPVAVQMHGCGGPGPMQMDYAKVARDAGVAAVIVDSLKPRGIGVAEARLTVCTGLRLRGAERAADLLATLEWLKTQPWADAGQVAATGWSHGAWAIMEALAGPADGSQTDVDLGAVKLAALFYPYAGPLARTASHGWGRNRPRVFACLAGRDSVVGRLAPRRAITRLQDDGLDVSVLDLPEATHCFDDHHYSVDPRTHYRADFAAEARAAYGAALRAALG
jgi:dienelactone hydrolase